MRRLGSLVAVLFASAALGCGGGSDGYTTGTTTTGTGSNSGASTSSSVSVGNDFFTPASTAVAPGTTVTWTWNSGGVQHNVTFDDGQKSPTQGSGTYTRAFAAAGTYNYHCTIHGAAMSGTVTVK